ncbi:hypothetical protein DPMN_160366 [Dreissena polymorpha]|uniref:Uncharacterized protein n=1 Tax=Dreissena polymorpha TaxID=45954 RepID=A0A9D4INP7_DREPO|nr:hypothetical protein DPMN_160366 [Dreissena polymorpha]
MYIQTVFVFCEVGIVSRPEFDSWVPVLLLESESLKSESFRSSAAFFALSSAAF